MTIRRILITAAVAAIAVSAFALSPEHTEFGKGPAQFLMTKEEAAQWKTITTDDAAEKFIALFWARRDPTPGTARNENREQFNVYVEQADKNFNNGKSRGALSDRGKTLILYGPPKKIGRIAQRQNASPDSSETDARDDSETMVWTYEDEAARKFFGQSHIELRFVDRLGRGDYRSERGGADLASAQQKAIAAMIAQPNLTEPPSFAPAQPAAPAPATQPAAPAAVPVQTELTSAELKNAVAEFKKSGTSAHPVFASTGEYVTSEGVTYAPVLLYIPKASAPAGEATFFGVVEDASGKSVLAFEHPAVKLNATRDDFFVDKSLTLPAGKYRGYFGIAEAGKPASIVAADMELAGQLDKDAPAASQLILANNVYALSEAQFATDPYAFGGLKVIPKADKVFHKADELWYFIELRNPGLGEAAATADGTTPAREPKLQVKLDVTGVGADGKTTKMSAPPMEIAAVPIKGVPNHYGVGNSIPLATFKPGDYTFTAKVIDTVSKTSYTVTDKFKVVE